ncbi:MAG: hypothetical protein J5U17_08660, partial [Candidatus Methanoperedens sp.]|nr:hypothetical protein [Candidatus Methanoperedens sp.]
MDASFLNKVGFGELKNSKTQAITGFAVLRSPDEACMFPFVKTYTSVAYAEPQEELFDQFGTVY